jgi:hypothetical protein
MLVRRVLFEPVAEQAFVGFSVIGASKVQAARSRTAARKTSRGSCWQFMI